MRSTATAVWQGGLKDGKGALTSASGVLAGQPYSFATRFEGAGGTNPEELVAAAHAGCFAMALAMILGEQGLTPARLDAEAAVTLDQVADGFAVTASHLAVRGEVPGASAEAFAAAAEAAKAGCPISKLLDAEITLDARLAG
jgi:osmotically inducible protein OsmC